MHNCKKRRIEINRINFGDQRGCFVEDFRVREESYDGGSHAQGLHKRGMRRTS